MIAMKEPAILTLAFWALAASAAPAFAQDSNPRSDALTIRLLPEDAELPDAITREIELPIDADGNLTVAEDGEANSTDGLTIANEAREDGRAFGEAAAAAAEANREEIGRGLIPNVEDLRPDHVPKFPEFPPTLGTPDVDALSSSDVLDVEQPSVPQEPRR